MQDEALPTAATARKTTASFHTQPDIILLNKISVKMKEEKDRQGAGEFVAARKMIPKDTTCHSGMRPSYQGGFYSLLVFFFSLHANHSLWWLAPARM